MSFVRLQVVLPSILAIACLADGITRALPVGIFSFRAWEAMNVHHPPTAPFEPSARYDSPRSFGDLANLGNMRDLRAYRRETFTTDAYGFRNPPGLAESGTVSVLLIGDSFAAGSGVADHLTLAGQLTTLGRTTYSVAPMQLRATALAGFVRMLGMKKGSWVIHQQTYLYDESTAWSVEPGRYPAVRPLERFRHSFTANVWPFRILVNQMWKSVQNDTLLVNPFRKNVQRLTLRNGAEMLFIAGETVADAGLSGDTLKSMQSYVKYVTSVSAEADRLGLRYLAVLVPVKFAVYRHLLAAPVIDGPRMPAVMAEMERQLAEADVAVVNLYPDLAGRATAEAGRHRYVYWRDDTHWNGSGILTAARVITRAMLADPSSAQ